MNCNEIRELMPDLAAGMGSGSQQAEAHLASCAGCAAELQSLRQTMTLLDEWRTPEPSSYFDMRLKARLRDEMARPASGWLQWLRRPALAFALAAIVVAAAAFLGNRSYFVQLGAINTKPPDLLVPAEPGTAVGDLQALEKNHDLYADFDILDELQVEDETATP